MTGLDSANLPGPAGGRTTWLRKNLRFQVIQRILGPHSRGQGPHSRGQVAEIDFRHLLVGPSACRLRRKFTRFRLQVIRRPDPLRSPIPFRLRQSFGRANRGCPISADGLDANHCMASLGLLLAKPKLSEAESEGWRPHGDSNPGSHRERVVS